MSQSLVLALGRSVGAHEGPSPRAARRVSVSHPLGDARVVDGFLNGKPTENPWKPMETHGNPWKTHGKPMETHGKPWKTHGKPWKTHGKPMENMDDLGLASFWETSIYGYHFRDLQNAPVSNRSREPCQKICCAILYILPLQSNV